MKKNKEFFSGKTWKEIFEKISFEKHLYELSKKLKNKKVIFYGAGTVLDYIVENYDLKGFNICGVADKKYEIKKEKYYNYNTFGPAEIKLINVDAIIITLPYPYKIYKYLKYEIYLNKRMPRIYFLINKPLSLYIEEIFN